MSPSQSLSGGGGRHKDRDWDGRQTAGKWDRDVRGRIKKAGKESRGGKERGRDVEGVATHSGIHCKSASCHSANADT